MRSAARWKRLTVDQSRSSKVRFEPGVVQGGDQGVEDIGNGASDHLAFGQRSRIGLVVEWTVAKELQFVEDDGRSEMTRAAGSMSS